MSAIDTAWFSFIQKKTQNGGVDHLFMDNVVQTTFTLDS